MDKLVKPIPKCIAKLAPKWSKRNKLFGTGNMQTEFWEDGDKPNIINPKTCIVGEAWYWSGTYYLPNGCIDCDRFSTIFLCLVREQQQHREIHAKVIVDFVMHFKAKHRDIWQGMKCVVCGKLAVHNVICSEECNKKVIELQESL